MLPIRRLMLTLAVAVACAGQSPAFAQGSTTPQSRLTPPPAAFLDAAAEWIDTVVDEAGDPRVAQQIAAGRQAAAAEAWPEVETMVAELSEGPTPPGLVPLVRALVGWAKGDANAHRRYLEEAAPAIEGAAPAFAGRIWLHLGQLAMERGDPAGAQHALAEAGRLAPDDPSVAFLAGRVAWMEGRAEAALAAFGHAVELAPTDPVAWFTLAEVRYRSGHRESAAAAARESTGLAPEWPAPRLQLARWLLADDRATEAFNLLLPVSGVARDVPEVGDLMREAVERAGRSAAFAEAAEQVRAAGDAAEDWARLGAWFAAADAGDEAIAAYQAAIAKAPTNAEYGFLLGGLRARRWDIVGAIAAYEQALANGFTPVGCYFNIGLMQMAAERPDEALAAFDRCIEAGGVPQYVMARKAATLLHAGRPEEAAAMARATLEDKGQDADTWRTLGQALLAQGQAQAAHDALLQSYVLDPDVADTLYWLARAELAMERPREALDRFRTMYALGSRSPQLAYWAGRAAHMSGYLDYAAFLYERALALTPGLADAWLGIGEIEQARGHLVLARRSYARAEDLGLDSAMVHFRLGDAAWAQNDVTFAYAELQAAVARDPKLHVAWQRLGAVQARRGELKAARQSFARAYEPGQHPWLRQRALERLLWGVLWTGAFLLAMILGARLRRLPPAVGLALFRARMDLMALLAISLLLPLALMILGQRMVYASFQLQRLTNTLVQGLNVLVAFRDGVFLGVLPLAFMWWRHGRPQFPGIAWPSAWRNILLGVGGFTLFAGPVIVTGLFRDTAMGAELVPRGRDFFNATPQSMAASLLGIGLVSSVTQEFFYRGVLYPLTRAQVGVVPAAIVTSLLFAGMHFQSAGFGLLALFGLLAVGLYQWTGSLVGPVVMHVLYNGWQILR